MSKLLDTRIPNSLTTRLTSSIPDQEAVPIISVDREGYPHAALLSYLEFIVKDEELYFFLSKESSSAANLQQRRFCTLLFLSTDHIFYLKGRAHSILYCDSQAVFRVELTTVLQDFPEQSEGATRFISGLRFGLDPPDLIDKLNLRKYVRDALGRQ